MKNSTLLMLLALAFLITKPVNAQDMIQKTTTFLMFEGDAEEAITFYTSLFENSEIVRITKAGPDGPGGPDAEGTVQHALFTLKGQPYMAIDSFGHNFTFTPSISLFVQCDSKEELETLFKKLSDGGQVMMPLDNYGFSTRFAWVSDRFGVSWQLNYGQLKFE
jgi:predicted 3-demethylubiquinone-9 3-methyltransferase (glyoxalase superfamily)